VVWSFLSHRDNTNTIKPV